MKTSISGSGLIFAAFSLLESSVNMSADSQIRVNLLVHVRVGGSKFYPDLDPKSFVVRYYGFSCIYGGSKGLAR